jgi:hypothetical protein
MSKWKDFAAITVLSLITIILEGVWLILLCYWSLKVIPVIGIILFLCALVAMSYIFSIIFHEYREWCHKWC